MTHRPLSDWIVALTAAPGGSWEMAGEVNDGWDAEDARDFGGFASGWDRTAIDLGGDRPALALRRSESEAVVEVDDHARPIRVSPPALEIVERIERDWPDPVIGEAELFMLAAEEVPLRFVLLDRLAAEGRPAPEVFHILPWGRVEALVRDVHAALAGAAPGEPIVVRHWFNPAGPAFTAALEQLDEALRDDDASLAREAAGQLCRRLRHYAVDRLPASLRGSLADLVERLWGRDEFLGPAARSVIGRLLAKADPGDGDRIRLDRSKQALLADGPQEPDKNVREARRPPFTLRMAVSETQQIRLTVTAPASPDRQAHIARTYGVMIAEVSVITSEAATSYLLPMRATLTGLTGQLRLPDSQAQFFEPELDYPPLGAAELELADPDLVERSLRGVESKRLRRLWTELGEGLPEHHPLRDLLLADPAA